jgi:hypothetical protein
MSDEIEEEQLTDEQWKVAVRVVTSTRTELLPKLLEDNQEKVSAIKELIMHEMELREVGVRRTIMIEEVMAL